MLPTLVTLVFVGFTTTVHAQFKCPTFPTPPNEPQNIIIDTDLLSFTDDVAAIAVANILQSKKFVNILGIVSDVTSNYSLPAIDAINTWYSHPDITLARGKRVTNTTFEPMVNPKSPQYITELGGNTDRFPQSFNASNAQDAVTFYKNTLTTFQKEKKKITIIAIGFLTNLNNLYNTLLEEKNTQLITDTVAELVVQGGSCNTSNNLHGAGLNLESDITSAQVVTKWPSLVTFFPGFEAGKLDPSAQATFTLPEGNPVRYVYETIDAPNKLGPHDIVATYYAIFGLKSLTDGNDIFTYGNKTDMGALQFTPSPKSALEDDVSDSFWNDNAKPAQPQRFVIVNDTDIPAINQVVNNLISCCGKQKEAC